MVVLLCAIVVGIEALEALADQGAANVRFVVAIVHALGKRRVSGGEVGHGSIKSRV
jgi:hypothetical protein